MAKKDITTKDDIKNLVDSFYNKVKENELLAHVFVTTMQIEWEKHLPKMYQFWEFILWQTGEYKGTPFDKHIVVNNKVALTPQHFDNWINLFYETVDELFEGENATSIKTKATNIKNVWSYKFSLQNQ
jgi:hemoglobin